MTPDYELPCDSVSHTQIIAKAESCLVIIIIIIIIIINWVRFINV
jgi:hypothetical protein